MEIQIDHVMFPVYLNNAFLDVVEEIWAAKKAGKVFAQPQNAAFKGVYLQSKSFYVEYLSNVKDQPYWTNAVYVVVPKKHWAFYKSPALVDQYFLVPKFGCGYALVSPDFPYLNSMTAGSNSYDGLTLLISEALKKEVLSIAGLNWSLPESGKIQVHGSLVHVHDIAVIDEKSKLVAPLLQPNPLLREFL
jgi:hypothetical protein